MKKIISTLLLLITISLTVSAQEEMSMDIENSTVYWLGSSFMGFNNHHGIVQFSEGTLKITNKKITGGSFVVDMSTIANKDGGYSQNLVDHLKDPDFFDVKKFPFARLVILNVTYENKTQIKVTANLMIKGIENTITFPAELDYEQKEMSANFTIDRTRWNISYSSTSVGIMKDKAIADEISFKVETRFK